MPRPASNNIKININVNVEQAVASVQRLTGSLTEAKTVASTIGKTSTKELEAGFKKSAEKSSTYIKNLIGALTDLKTIVKSVGLAMGVGFGVFALGSVMRKTVEGFNEIENGMRKIWTVTDLTNEQLKELQDNLLAIAKTSPIAIKDIMEGAYYALSSGVNVDELIDFMEIANKAAVAGYATIKDTVDLLTTIRNAYGYTIEYMANVTDKLFGAMFVAKAEFQDFAQNLGKVIPVASQLGIALDEVLAAVATLTKVGVSTEKAATYLSQLMNSIINPSAQAQKMAEELGVELNATALSALGLGDYLKYLKERLEEAGYTTQDKMVTALSALIGEARAARAVFGLMSQDFTVYDDASDKIKNSLNDVDEAYKKAATSLKNIWNEIKKQLTIGMAEIVGGIAKFVEWALEEEADATKTFVDTLKKNLNEIGVSTDQLASRLTSTVNGLQDTYNKAEEISMLIQSGMNKFGEAMVQVANLSGVGDFEGVEKVIADLANEFKELGINIESSADSLEGLIEQLKGVLEAELTVIEAKLAPYEYTMYSLKKQLRENEELIKSYKEQSDKLKTIQLPLADLYEQFLFGDFKDDQDMANQFIATIKDVVARLEKAGYEEFAKPIKQRFKWIFDERYAGYEVLPFFVLSEMESFVKAEKGGLKDMLMTIGEIIAEIDKKYNEYLSTKKKIEQDIASAEEAKTILEQRKQSIQKSIEELDVNEIMKKALSGNIQAMQRNINFYFRALRETILQDLNVKLPRDIQNAFDKIIKYSTWTPEQIEANAQQYIKGLTQSINKVQEYLNANQDILGEALVNKEFLKSIIGELAGNLDQIISKIKLITTSEVANVFQVDKKATYELAESIMDLQNNLEALNVAARNTEKQLNTNTEIVETAKDVWRQFSSEVGILKDQFERRMFKENEFDLGFDRYLTEVFNKLIQYKDVFDKYYEELKYSIESFYTQLFNNIKAYYQEQLSIIEDITDPAEQRKRLLALYDEIDKVAKDARDKLGKNLYESINLGEIFTVSKQDVQNTLLQLAKQQIEPVVTGFMTKILDSLKSRQVKEFLDFMEKEYQRTDLYYQKQLLTTEGDKVKIYQDEIKWLDEIYKKSENILGITIKDSDEYYEILKYQINILTKRRQIASILAKEYQLNVDDVEVNQQKLDYLKQQIDSANKVNKKYQEILSTFNDIDSSLEDWKQTEYLEGYINNLEDTKEKLQNLRKEWKALAGAAGTAGLVEKYQNTLTLIDTRIDKVNTLIDVLKTFNKNYQEIYNNIIDIDAKINEATNMKQVEELKQQLRGIKQTIEELKKSAQSQGELKALDELINLLGDSFEAASKKVDEFLQKSYKQLKKALDDTTQWVKNYQNILQTLKDVQFVLINETDINQLQRAKQELLDLKKRLVDLQGEAIDMHNLETYLQLQQLIKENLDELETKIQNIQQKMEELNDVQLAIKGIRILSHLFGDLSGVVSNFIDGFENKINDLSTDIKSGKIGWQDAMKEATVNGIVEALPELEAYFRSWGNDLGDTLADGVKTVEYAKIGYDIGTIIGTALGDPIAGGISGAVVGALIGVIEWFVNLFKSEWQKTYDDIRKSLPDTISNALSSVKEPKELKKRLKETIFNAAYSGLVDAFMKTAYMKQFMDKLALYMTDFLYGKITAEQFAQFVDENISGIDWSKLETALKVFYDSMQDVSNTAKATEESLAYSSVKAVSEQTANIMVSYLRDVRDTLLRIETIALAIKVNTANIGSPRIPYRGARI